MPRPVLKTPICDRLGIEYPIILAGMGSSEGAVAGAELVAAVSEAGGLGVLGAVGFTPEQIHEQCARIRSLTKKPFGIDTLLPASAAQPSTPPPDAASALEDLDPAYRAWTQRMIERFDLEQPSQPAKGSGVGWTDLQRQEAQLRAIIDERVAVFASGLGSPGPYVEALHRAGTTVFALVGNVKNALRVKNDGADVIVAQGHESGGHTGYIGTFALTPQVVDAVSPTPVVLAGGVGDGRGVAAALALGAQAVWVGTAFIATNEASASDEHKQRVVGARDEDARVTRLYSGKTMRAINNPLMEEWERSRLPALPMGQQGYVAATVSAAARASGRSDLLGGPAGQIAGMVTRIRPAADVLDAMVREAVDVLQDLTRQRVTIDVSV